MMARENELWHQENAMQRRAFAAVGLDPTTDSLEIQDGAMNSLARVRGQNSMFGLWHKNLPKTGN